jgi:hypothetical protein
MINLIIAMIITLLCYNSNNICWRNLSADDGLQHKSLQRWRFQCDRVERDYHFVDDARSFL